MLEKKSLVFVAFVLFAGSVPAVVVRPLLDAPVVRLGKKSGIEFSAVHKCSELPPPVDKIVFVGAADDVWLHDVFASAASLELLRSSKIPAIKSFLALVKAKSTFSVLFSYEHDPKKNIVIQVTRGATLKAEPIHPKTNPSAIDIRVYTTEEQLPIFVKPLIEAIFITKTSVGRVVGGVLAGTALVASVGYWKREAIQKSDWVKENIWDASADTREPMKKIADMLAEALDIPYDHVTTLAQLVATSVDVSAAYQAFLDKAAARPVVLLLGLGEWLANKNNIVRHVFSDSPLSNLKIVVVNNTGIFLDPIVMMQKPNNYNCPFSSSPEPSEGGLVKKTKIEFVTQNGARLETTVYFDLRPILICVSQLILQKPWIQRHIAKSSGNAALRTLLDEYENVKRVWQQALQVQR